MPDNPTGTQTHTNTSLQDCIDNCNKIAPAANDLPDGRNKGFRDFCITNCRVSFKDPTIQNQVECSQCSPTNFPACLKCGSGLFSKGLISVGVNLLLGGIVLLGIYFLFKQEFDPIISKTTKAVTTATAL